MNDTNDFAALLAEFDQTHKTAAEKGAKPGDQVKGRVVAITEDQVFINLGGKAEGIMDAASLRDPEGQLTVAVGDEVTVTVAVTAIDTKVPSVTFKGPGGNSRTVKVKDPAKLKGVSVERVREVTTANALSLFRLT